MGFSGEEFAATDIVAFLRAISFFKFSCEVFGNFVQFRSVPTFSSTVDAKEHQRAFIQTALHAIVAVFHDTIQCIQNLLVKGKFEQFAHAVEHGHTAAKSFAHEKFVATFFQKFNFFSSQIICHWSHSNSIVSPGLTISTLLAVFASTSALYASTS